MKVIAGSYRRRIIPVPDVPACRPTLSRIRETMFAWLEPYLHGATCLDLFAGTGMLGIEALSRGAAQVVFMEQEAILAEHIQQCLHMLHCDRGHVIHGSFPNHIPNLANKPYDIIFLDPPYQQGMLIPAITWLEAQDLSHDKSLIMAEWDRSEDIIPPPTWHAIKSGHSKRLCYALWQPQATSEMRSSE